MGMRRVELARHKAHLHFRILPGLAEGGREAFQIPAPWIVVGDAGMLPKADAADIAAGLFDRRGIGAGLLRRLAPDRGIVKILAAR
jgi:hypothetical protein